MPTDKPNILLIILDTLRRDRLSAYGHHQETSPAFDAFAGDATLFERAIAPAQWTVPSHASMFTGVYPSTHRLTEADGMLAGSDPALAEILQVDGYHTVGFCNNPLVGVIDNGLTRGFSEFYNYAGASPNRPVDVRRSALQRQFTRQFRRFARRVSNQFARSDWLFRVSLNPLLTPIWTRFINYKGHTERSIDDLINYWGTHTQTNDEQPLFVFLNLMGAHLPYRPPQDYLKRFAPDLANDQHAYRFMGQFNANAARWASPTDPPLADWERHTIDGFYNAEVAHQDYHLGRLLLYLKQSGALDNTLVIIAADHGEGHGDHDFFGHGFVVYQELVHVPLVIHHPERFPAGRRIQTNISTRRIFHTVLDLAGITPPLDAADPNADVGGLSLTRSLNGRPDKEKGIAFSEAFPPQTFLHVLKHRQPETIDRLGLTQVRRGIYDGAHKLALVGQQAEGLFDLTQDPAEENDLAEQQPAVVDDLREQVNQFVTAAESRRTGNHANGKVHRDVVDNLRDLGYMD